MMTFWTGLLAGWILGSVGSALVLMFFAGVKSLDEDRAERPPGSKPSYME